MSWAYLLVGIVVGALVVSFGVVGSIQNLDGPEMEEVDGNAVCEKRFGGNWTNENMTRDFGNQSVGLSCTNGTATRNISVAVEVEGLSQ